MIVKIPAFIDMHCHFRDFEQADKETVETGLKSAIKGGFGAVLTMANTKPVNDTPKITREILKKAEKFCNEIKLYPVGAATKALTTNQPVNFEEMKKAGCIAFSNDGMPFSDFKTFKKLLMTGELILSHLENETQEAIWQVEAFKEVVKSSEAGACPMPRLHFCHISKKTTIDVIRNAKKELTGLSAETCPHYFTFTRENIDKTGRFKMNPPLGDELDRHSVIKAVKDGTIDVISTDHAPHLNQEKLMPYDKAPNGVTGLETAFSLTLMRFGLDVAVQKMALNPRKILGIDVKKEITVDLDASWTVKGSDLQSKCKITPYENMNLKGKILC